MKLTQISDSCHCDQWWQYKR